MHVPKGVLVWFSSWWSSPNVWPISWHITRLRHAVVLYADVLKYVSFSLTVPCVMWLPFTHTCAMPSHPVLPYRLLQTSTRPADARQLLKLESPGTICVSSSVERLQSEDAVARTGPHDPERLLPSFMENGDAVRAQWYVPHV